MDIANQKYAEEKYSQYHKDTLIEEYLQKRTTAEEEKILVIELENRGISLEIIQQFVKENKLDVYPNGLTYANLALRTNRVMAYLIDTFYVFCVLIATSIIAFSVKADYEIISVITVLPYWGYTLIKDALPNGQSFGKKSMNIKVISSVTAKNCTVIQSIIRNVVKCIPFINIADALYGGKYKRQTIGDILARTIVIDVASK
jgi:uncharacterized RDD family membrane protein YckC